MDANKSIGFIKYEGKIVADGILDARAAARALNGLDTAMRFFIALERPDLASVDLPVPIRIQRGSWEALIPTTPLNWILTAAGVAGTTYLSALAKKLAENDVKNAGLSDVLRTALKGVQWLFRLGKHLGHLDLKKVTHGVKWEEETVGLPNAEGKILRVPIRDLKRLASCPKELLSEIASVIELERSLVVGVNENGRISEVKVTQKERHIFFAGESEEELLFPELKHGQNVELEGLVTRGNGRSNTIGFLYQEHVLTCIPEKGRIVRFKKNLFLRCKIVGVISRADEKGNPVEARPKILFSNLHISKHQHQAELPLGDEDEPVE